MIEGNIADCTVWMRRLASFPLAGIRTIDSDSTNLVVINLNRAIMAHVWATLLLQEVYRTDCIRKLSAFPTGVARFRISIAAFRNRSIEASIYAHETRAGKLVVLHEEVQ